MSPGPQVWLAGPHEAETVARLLVGFRDHLGYRWPSQNAFLAGVETLLDQPQTTDFLLGSPDADSPPAAVCQLRYRFGIWRAGTDCWLEDLFVHEAARGTGLGRATMVRALERARERGAKRVQLDANESNPRALALYESLGFSCTSKAFDGGRDLFFGLTLDP